MHRLVKRDAACIGASPTVELEGARTASLQAIVEHDLIEWQKVWTRLKHVTTAPWRTEAIGDTQLPPITASDVLNAAQTFKTTTSVGCDVMPPRTFAWLSAPLRAAVADLLNLAEETGTWPSAVATALVHLIPKPDGGRRPIGILPSIVRIWERCRKTHVQRWMRENKRDFDWATQGRSAEMAAWHQSIMDEAATAQGLTSATMFLDLAKAFENVRLQDVWNAGRRLGFPLRILRLALEAFAFARRLSYHKAVTDPVLTLSAILVGGGFAQVAVLLVMIAPIEAVTSLTLGPSVTMTVCEYVDDIALHAIGLRHEVVQALVQATEQLVTHLEEELYMQVSRRERWAIEGKGKTVATASSAAAIRSLTTPMRRLGSPDAGEGEALGRCLWPWSQDETRTDTAIAVARQRKTSCKDDTPWEAPRSPCLPYRPFASDNLRIRHSNAQTRHCRCNAASGE